MKYASAMKYGGELVDAVDCDYDSFKELIPLCPNCKEPVFLRTGGPRESVKGKAYQIGPHWCHFKGISAEQVAGCELRVNGYTEKDRAKIAAQARGQRLKLLQRWFWDVVKQHSWGLVWILENGGELISNSTDPVVTYVDSDVLAIRKQIIADLDKYSAEQILDFVLSPRNQLGRYIRSGYEWFYSTEYGNDGFEIYMQRILSRPQDMKVSLEVLHFLASRQNFHLLQSFLNTMASCLWSAARSMYDGDEDEVKEKWWEDPLSALVLWVFEIPWASEFQRLEAEARQRKGAA